jgi:uncharacterized protein YndB with AHSA1/START domain
MAAVAIPDSAGVGTIHRELPGSVNGAHADPCDDRGGPVRVTASAQVERPIEEVFAFVADFENSPRWQSMVRESQKLSEGPIGRGARFREYANAMGSKGWVTIEITEYEPNRRVAYRSSRFGALAPIAGFTFEPAAGGTSVTFSGDPNPIAPLKPLSPLISRIATRLWRRNLDSLKEVLES